jgi:hypothetical protein
MLYSIANAAPRNVESYGVNTLLPETIRGQAEQLVHFLEEYYNYLNGPNGPSLEINNVLLDKDLDNVSRKYLDSIQGLIAKNVPNSRVLDRVNLYKIVVRYYNSRGSEDNILTMFKLLFNENASIRYPKELLFEPSSSPEKSLPSHTSKIQDSYYWQNFSYVVRASLDSSVWADAFKNFLHPAGLQMFYELAVELFSRNTFDVQKRPTFNIVEDNTEWIKQLLMVYPGQHTPIYQPGWFRELLVRFILQADSRSDDWSGDLPLGPDWPHPTTQEAYFYLAVLRLIIQSSNSRNSLVRYDYDYNGFKFIDECTLKDSGFLNNTIDEANETYRETNACKFLNLSTYITTGIVVFDGKYALTLNGEALTSLIQFPGEQPLSSFSYKRPGGTFKYLRPDGTSTYQFLESPVLTFNAEPQNTLLHQNREYAQFQDQDYIELG